MEAFAASSGKKSGAMGNPETRTQAAVGPAQGEGVQGGMEYDGLFWRRMAYRGAIVGPEIWKRVAPVVTGLVIFMLVKENRHGAVANFRRILSDAAGGREPGAFATYRAAARMFVEFSRVFAETSEVQQADFSGADVDEVIDLELPPNLDLENAFSGDKGVVVLTSHFGCWEIGARVMSRFERPVNLVMAHEGNPTVQAFQDEMRHRHGLKVIHSDDSKFASVEMLRALQRGEVVAIQLDRSAPGQVTREVSFFGKAAPFQIGPFHLARAAGVPLWPVFTVRKSRRKYRLLPSKFYRIPRRADDQALADVQREVVALFESHVRHYPHQWFQFHDFWANDPA